MTQRDGYVSDRIAKILAERIRDGTYSPSDALPPQSSIALELGVSKVAVGYAEKNLSDRGLIIKRGKSWYPIPIK